MKKIMAILLSSVLLLTALSISVSAAKQQAPAQKLLMGDATLIITVYYGDGTTPCDNATIEITKNGGGYSRTAHTNENGDPVTIIGVPEGLYTLHAYRPHPTLGKKVGIFLWGEAFNNQAEVIGGQDNYFDLILVGGFFKAVAYSQPSSS